MKKAIVFGFLAILAMLATGCTASYQQAFMQESNNQFTPARFLLITPVNGSYEGTEYPTSGNDVITILSKELSRYTQSISTIPNPIPVQNLDDNTLQQFDYIIAPQILHWEDRLTGWSFRPDRIEVRFDIYNNQRQLINSYSVQARSAYVVWISKQPKSLLPAPIRTMLKKMFSQTKN
jgi:hypothetical protein